MFFQAIRNEYCGSYIEQGSFLLSPGRASSRLKIEIDEHLCAWRDRCRVGVPTDELCYNAIRLEVAPNVARFEDLVQTGRRAYLVLTGEVFV